MMACVIYRYSYEWLSVFDSYYGSPCKGGDHFDSDRETATTWGKLKLVGIRKKTHSHFWSNDWYRNTIIFSNTLQFVILETPACHNAVLWVRSDTVHVSSLSFTYCLGRARDACACEWKFSKWVCVWTICLRVCVCVCVLVCEQSVCGCVWKMNCQLQQEVSMRQTPEDHAVPQIKPGDAKGKKKRCNISSGHTHIHTYTHAPFWKPYRWASLF